ncbi:MAG: lipoyl(octanoyl) transferase LipB [Pseudomonadota bacterium]
MSAPQVRVQHLGLQPYEPIEQRMREFTRDRTPDTADELWFLEHPPVFTLGQASKPEHLLAPGDIPVVQTNRGGQVTYHGPGQLVVYCLLDLTRRGYGARALVSRLEAALIETLARYRIEAHAKREAPGVYVEERKIASLGLRISRGCSYHGLALNVAMDLSPFSRINPCGHRGLEMTQVAELGGPNRLKPVAERLQADLLSKLTAPT